MKKLPVGAAEEEMPLEEAPKKRWSFSRRKDPEEEPSVDEEESEPAGEDPGAPLKGEPCGVG